MCCSVEQCALHCFTVCCSVLQCVAVCCSVLQCCDLQIRRADEMCCSVLQCVAVCCSAATYKYGERTKCRLFPCTSPPVCRAFRVRFACMRYQVVKHTRNSDTLSYSVALARVFCHLCVGWENCMHALSSRETRILTPCHIMSPFSMYIATCVQGRGFRGRFACMRSLYVKHTRNSDTLSYNVAFARVFCHLCVGWEN